MLCPAEQVNAKQDILMDNYYFYLPVHHDGYIRAKHITLSEYSAYLKYIQTIITSNNNNEYIVS